jgi:electron transfer flavoprotein beta subunit
MNFFIAGITNFLCWCLGWFPECERKCTEIARDNQDGFLLFWPFVAILSTPNDDHWHPALSKNSLHPIMKIVLCINHVPDTETKVKVGSDGTSLDPAGVNFMLNPYDEFAIEAGLKLKEQFTGETIALSLGGDANKETLRKALAMGVDKAVLLKDSAVRDSYGVAWGIADALKQIGPDCILFGKQSIDYAAEQVPGLVAELLGWPSVSVVVALEAKDGKVHCHREIEGGHEIVEASFPVVLTTQKGLNEPRYPSLKGIMGAKSKPIEERAPAATPPLVVVTAMQKPPAKQAGKIVGTDAAAVPELVRLLHEEAKVI